MAERFLYEYVEPADALAERLDELTYSDYSELGNTAKDAAAMPINQQEQLAKVLNKLLETRPALDVVELLLRAGLTPSELLFGWRVPRDVLEIAQKRIKPREVD